MAEICGILHGRHQAQPRDDHGCVLPLFHEGPHEFVDRDGVAWRWETDLFCDCEWCRRAEGDYCTTYWRKADDERLAAAEAEFASWLQVAAGVSPHPGNTAPASGKDSTGGRR